MISIRLGERVKVMNVEEEWQYGSVLWVGNLPERMVGTYAKELFAGVEWEEPVGRGTGHFGGVQYFKAKSGHAAFVPVSMIAKPDEDEVFESDDEVEQALNLPSVTLNIPDVTKTMDSLSVESNNNKAKKKTEEKSKPAAQPELAVKSIKDKGSTESGAVASEPERARPAKNSLKPGKQGRPDTKKTDFGMDALETSSAHSVPKESKTVTTTGDNKPNKVNCSKPSFLDSEGKAVRSQTILNPYLKKKSTASSITAPTFVKSKHSTTDVLSISKHALSQPSRPSQPIRPSQPKPAPVTYARPDGTKMSPAEVLARKKRVSFSSYNFKTVMCTYYSQTGYCQHGDDCHFAHGSAELEDFKTFRDNHYPADFDEKFPVGFRPFHTYRADGQFSSKAFGKEREEIKTSSRKMTASSKKKRSKLPSC